MPPCQPLNSVEQELVALRSEINMLRSGGSGKGNRLSYYSSQTLPPPLTPNERQWCMQNRACFRCREADAQHRASHCPRFPPQQFRSVDEYSSYGSQSAPPSVAPSQASGQSTRPAMPLNE